jgi:thioredoxin 1
MADDAKYVTLTDDNFQDEVLNADEPVLVDFWAEWCGPCRMIAPMIEELADDFDGRAKIGKLDVDHNSQVAMQYGIRSIPTLLFFKDGEVADQMIGAPRTKKVLSQKLEALAGQPA